MDGEQASKNASDIVFPNTPTMLCVWHVNQCVLANCKSVFEKGEDWIEFYSLWRTLISLPTIEQFEESWLNFYTRYSTPKTQRCLDYLQKEWLKDGQKQRLLSAYTDYYLHFGLRTTSRVESSHVYIKRYLGGKKSKGDLFSS